MGEKWNRKGIDNKGERWKMSSEKNLDKTVVKKWEKVKVPKMIYLIDIVFWLVVAGVTVLIITTILSIFIR